MPGLLLAVLASSCLHPLLFTILDLREQLIELVFNHAIALARGGLQPLAV